MIDSAVACRSFVFAPEGRRSVATGEATAAERAERNPWEEGLHWILFHEKFPALADFAWQEGYSVFSVSKSQEPVVRTYIRNQPEHHRKTDFKSELLKLLRAHEIEFDERYVFD
ncbi:MAG: transposase [Planctomycetales bacterium]